MHFRRGGCKKGYNDTPSLPGRVELLDIHVQGQLHRAAQGADDMWKAPEATRIQGLFGALSAC